MSNPAISPKKYHRKSRLGCKVCKARKIKCDEARPICANCYRRFPNPENECVFENPNASSSRNARFSSTTLSISSISSSLPVSRAIELRLFHHYSTVTCISLPTCDGPAGLHMLKTIIPSLAFECPYIYSAILSISSLHLLYLTPDDPSLRAATYTYIDETVSAHREELSNPSESKNLNRLAASILLTMHAKLRTRCEANTGIPYSLPTNYFMLQNGAAEMWKGSTGWDNGIKAYVNSYSRLAPSQPWTRPEPQLEQASCLHGKEFPYDPLPEFLEFSMDIDDEGDRKAIYEKALKYLDFVKGCMTAGERESFIQHRLGTMPAVLGTPFCTLMRDRDLVALVIVARFFALFKFVDEPWWVNGMPEYEVRGLESLVPEKWGWGLEWPLAILEKDFRYTLRNL